MPETRLEKTRAVYPELNCAHRFRVFAYGHRCIRCGSAPPPPRTFAEAIDRLAFEQVWREMNGDDGDVMHHPV